MSKIIIPAKREESGPWLLDEASFLKLNHVLTEVSDLLDKSFKKERKDIDYLKKDDSHPHSNGNSIIKEIILISEDDTQIVEDSIDKVLQNPHLGRFDPFEFKINYRYGDQNFLTINLGDDDYIQYDIETYDLEIKYQIKYLLDKWINNNRPSRILRAWNSSSGFMIFISGFILLLSFVSVFFPDKESYQSKLEREAKQIIESGIDSLNITRAVELLLEMQSGYVPSDYNPQSAPPSQNWIKAFVLSFCFLIISIIKPVTIIGLGRNTVKVKLLRNWIRIVTILLPTMLILTPLSKKISEWLF